MDGEVCEHLHHDHDVAQLTRLQSEPHKLLSRRVPGKSTLPVSPVQMLARREANFSGRSRFTSADSCHIQSRYLPHNGPRVIDKLQSFGYVTQFSHDGSLLVAGFWDGRIRVYNVDRGWNVRNNIRIRGFPVCDTSLSPDKRFLVYANMSHFLHIVNVESATMESDPNIREIHKGLNFAAAGDPTRHFNANLISSVKFSTDGRELVAGSSNSSIYVYDLGENRLSVHVGAHRSPVSTVCFADESGQIIYSGGEEGLCKVWDRRILTYEQASGILVGHVDGVSFIDSRGDSCHLISNARDHSIKLWDIRKMSSNITENAYKKRKIPLCDIHKVHRSSQGRIMRNFRHPYDISLATYRGHEVYGVPIRCYFSPEKSTGQKYIYTGSSDGSVYIYDLLTGAQVARLNHGRGIVRDCSWHPYFPSLVNSSRDGVIAKWDFSAL
ncbi:LEC14B homolog [Apium graveolens]|uniref:LEC14B homolog n=1 Tax=Apium graveolens TaxID=4045 RepID=UPI003D7BFC77